MNKGTNDSQAEAVAGGSDVRFTVQPERELQANWEVDLAKKLEDYLLKICFGQVTASESLDNISVNFAEGSAFLKKKIFCYSRLFYN